MLNESIKELLEATRKLGDFLDTVDWQRVEEVERYYIAESEPELSGEAKAYCNRALIALWQYYSILFSHAQEHERDLRLRIVAFDFDKTKTKGVQTVAIEAGYKLKATKDLSFSFVKNAHNKTDKAAIERALQAIEKLSPEGKFIADKLVSWSPTLSESTYMDLSSEQKALIDPVIIKKPSLPKLELIEPKPAKN